MLTIAVFFGGKSVEHDVSIVTAQQLMQNINREKYTVVPVYISREGDWYSGEKLMHVEAFRHFDAGDPAVTRVYLPANTRVKQLYRFTPEKRRFKRENPVFSKIDAALLAMHGLNGEDGTLQGLLEMAGVPYTSSGVLGSAAGMDKILMKAAFAGAGFPVLPYTYFDRQAWENDQETVLDQCEDRLTYPMFVKPSNLGSSIGISKARDRAELAKAIALAVQYDHRVLVEKGLDAPKEINCSALGFGDKVKASVCEMPAAKEDFLTFSDKYLSGGKNEASMEALSRRIPAPIPEDMTARVRQMTVDIFKLMDCKGVVRIDYIADHDLANLYVNEINTIPGSFAFYLWEPLGISYAKLIDILIETAFQAYEARKENNFAFDSEIIAKFALGSQKSGKFGKL
ncbi:MAG: D-alanine--D-alanine ligase [Clostridia bacterium]|nr:D-alanine--D-alanine ligase [Clostridia bacterium]